MTGFEIGLTVIVILGAGVLAFYSWQAGKNPSERTSREWAQHYNIELGRDILDPDGWDRGNFDYSWNQEIITRQEFLNRVCFSTVRMKNEDGRIKVGSLIITKLSND